jgi:hypothetical protein
MRVDISKARSETKILYIKHTNIEERWEIKWEVLKIKFKLIHVFEITMRITGGKHAYSCLERFVKWDGWFKEHFWALRGFYSDRSSSAEVIK